MKQLQNLSIVAPGFYGLNSQEAGVTLSSNYAQTATNVVIDKYGRLGARKGWTFVTAPSQWSVDLLVLVSKMTAIYVGSTSKDTELEAFLNETVGGYARHDTDNSGNTTIEYFPDINNVLKYYLDKPLDAAVVTWIETNVLDAMLADFTTETPTYTWDDSLFVINGMTTPDEPLRFLMEHNADGSSVFLSGGNHQVFSGGVNSELIDITPTSYVISDNDWSGASLYDRALVVQENHEPLVYDAAATPVMQAITNYTGSAQNYGSSYPHYAIAAYGRFWTHNKNAVYWSTDIADAAFPCFCGGTSGSLNISAVLPDNFDDIVSIAVHNDFLVILCKHNIVLYSGASNPIGATFQLADIITGVGCVAKNSVQSTGNDLIFLSDTGVRSLGRLITEKSLPMRDLTKNVRDELLLAMENERANYGGSLDHVCSVYSESNAFYLLSFPSINTVYVLDMRTALQDGSSRVTKWSMEVFALLRTKDRDVLMGVRNGIGRYGGYQDNGDSYDISYLSHYLDFQDPTKTKILKQLKTSVIGGSGQNFKIKIGIDYSTNFSTYDFTVQTAGTTAYFGEAEYSISEYSGASDLNNLKSSVGGSGNIIQIGFEATVNNNPISVQSLDCYLATGRIK